MKVLVTGGAGFIGSNFIRWLLEDDPEARVVNFDKLTYAGNLENLASVADSDRYEFCRGDISDRERALQGARARSRLPPGPPQRPGKRSFRPQAQRAIIGRQPQSDSET